MKKIAVLVMALFCLSSFSFAQQRSIQKGQTRTRIQHAAARHLAPYMRAVQRAEQATEESYFSIVNLADLLSWPMQEEYKRQQSARGYKNAQYPGLRDGLRNSRWTNYTLAFEPQYMTQDDLKAVENFLKADPYRVNFDYKTDSYKLGIVFTVSTVDIKLRQKDWMVRVDPFLKILRVWRYDVRPAGSGRVETFVSSR